MANSIHIEYYGVDPSETDLIHSPEFAEALDSYDLILVNENGDELITPPSGDEFIFVKNEEDGKVMSVLFDDITTVENPSEAFEEVLMAMDTFSKRRLQTRLFTFTANDDEYESEGSRVDEDHAAFLWEYDISSGEYEDPKSW
jgi:hypothetical protein